MNRLIALPGLARRLLLALALGWGLPATASAFSVPAGASMAELTAAIIADGIGTDHLAGQASSLMAQGVSPGDVVQALLTAGYGTFDVVREVLVQGVLTASIILTGDAVQIQADALVREVATRVFFLQGSSVRVIVYDAVLAARQALLDLGKLPRDLEGTRFVRAGVTVAVLIDESLAAASAEGQNWQSETAPGGEASVR